MVQTLRRVGAVGDPFATIAEEGESLKEERPRSAGIVGTLPEAEEERPVSVLATPAVRAQARRDGGRTRGGQGDGAKGERHP